MLDLNCDLSSKNVIKKCFPLQNMNFTNPIDENSVLLQDIHDCLNFLKYDQNLFKTLEDLESNVEAGVKSPQFLTLVRFLVKEVTSLCDLQGHDDLQEADLASEAGMIKLSSLLRDLECPHSLLTEGPVTSRLENKKAKLILLDFFLAEIINSVEPKRRHSSKSKNTVSDSLINDENFEELILDACSGKPSKKTFFCDKCPDWSTRGSDHEILARKLDLQAIGSSPDLQR